MTDEPKQHRRPRFRRAAFFIVLGMLAFGCYQALIHPKTPLPDGWNPLAGFAVIDDVTPLTTWKMRRVLSDPEMCLAAVQDAANIRALEPLEASANCHIRNRVSLSQIGDARIDNIETSCAIALRMAMWEHHGLQPAAREIFGSQVEAVRQVGSYNCRQIRTVQGSSGRWSTHATADAIDITGFDLSDGSRIRLINDWDGELLEAAFLRAARDSSCTWFATTLGPDFNSLHADHFHLQAYGWGACR